jgi:hypothetical protein
LAAVDRIAAADAVAVGFDLDRTVGHELDGIVLWVVDEYLVVVRLQELGPLPDRALYLQTAVAAGGDGPAAGLDQLVALQGIGLDHPLGRAAHGVVGPLGYHVDAALQDPWPWVAF